LGLDDLLRNKLALDRNARVSGMDGANNSFLCVEISDEDLPWDLEETDW